MPSRRQPHLTDTSPVPYRSTDCRLGTHSACTESSPAPAPDDIPVIYEACDCPCHSMSGGSAPERGTRRSTAPSSGPQLLSDGEGFTIHHVIDEGRTQR
jgi:hypothetical protein